MSVTPKRLGATAAGQPLPLMLGMGWFPDQAGGLSRYFRGLHAALTAAGSCPVAVVIGPASGTPHRVRVASDATWPLPRRLISYTAAALRAGRGTDLLDTHFALYAAMPVLASSLRRRPLIVHFHGPWADESRSNAERASAVAAKRAIERWVYQRADRLIVLSSAFRRLLIEDYGVSASRVIVVLPGVDAEYFSPGEGGERSRLDIPDDTWVAVTIRRLVPRMGIDVLLRSWAELCREGIPGLLAVIGEGPLRKPLEGLAHELGIGSRVRFLGRVGDDELRTWYRAADVSVVPSLELEGFGLVALEAMACGTPVVASDVGGLPEVVGGLDNSLLVPAGESAALAARLRRAYDRTEPLPSRAASRRHAEDFAWAAVAQRHQDIYRAVVTEQQGGRPNAA